MSDQSDDLMQELAKTRLQLRMVNQRLGRAITLSNRNRVANVVVGIVVVLVLILGVVVWWDDDRDDQFREERDEARLVEQCQDANQSRADIRNAINGTLIQVGEFTGQDVAALAADNLTYLIETYPDRDCRAEAEARKAE